MPRPPETRIPEIQAYGGGGFRIGGERVEGSILIMDALVRPWRVGAVADLQADDLQAALDNAGAVEFVLLGTGPQTRIAPRSVREALQRAGLGLEVMNTPEACRLYNVLAGDGRQIAAALIAI